MQRRVLLTCFALAACSGSSEGNDQQTAKSLVEGADTSVSFYRDVKPILKEKCAQCHNDGGMGGFSLVSYADAKPLAGLIKSVVEDDVMPPWRAAGPLNQYQGDRRLTDAQKSTLLSWAEQGAPEGNPSDEAPDLVTGRRGLPRVDLTLAIQEPYAPTEEDTDDYRCFPLDWKFDKTQYIEGLSIEPGDKRLVHHGIVYLVSPDGVNSVRRNDQADPKPGYECMGGPGSWLTSYEPGGFGEVNPGGVAFEVRPGSMLVLQMHYNTLRVTGQDRTQVQLMLADKAERIGAVHLVMNQSWVARRMPIPANNPNVVHKWQGRPYSLSRNGLYELYWADLHAHTRATSMKMGIVRAGTGEYVNLLDIPEWSFEWQETFNFAKPVLLQPNDQLSVECHFNNTAENQPIVNGKLQPVKDVNWGERAADEMCLGNVLAHRLPDPPQPDAGVSAPTSGPSGLDAGVPSSDSDTASVGDSEQVGDEDGDEPSAN